MASSSSHDLPKLRAIDVRRIDYSGQPSFSLRDPLQISDQYVIVPQALGPLLMLLDGTSTLGELYSQLARQLGAQSGPALLDQLLDTLDRALLLDNANFTAARARVLTEYREAPFRPMGLAGQSYPASAIALRRMLDQYLSDAGEVEPASPTSRGLLSPHIDYARGGPVYANVWKSAAAMAREADVVVMLATDHYSPALLTLTRQNYATPYGILPADQGIVDRLAKAIGEEAAFASELYHRNEHSVELVAVWLHHMRAGKPCILVPVLCGSFAPFIQGNGAIEQDALLERFGGALRELAHERRTLFVISGDLAHVGPAFGGMPLNATSEARLKADDQQLLATLGTGDAKQFFETIRQVGDRNNVCGLPPAYLALRALEETRGTQYGYARCPADDYNTSAVTVAGMIFS